jgi:hypothetical protein
MKDLNWLKLKIYRRETLMGSVAQLVEQRTENPCVGGSIPSRATLNIFDIFSH